MLISFPINRDIRINPKKNSCSIQPKLHLKNQLAYDQISFGKKAIDFDLKSIPKIPCAYCGIDMITNEEKLRFGQEFTDLTGQKLRKKLAFIAKKDQFPIVQKVAKLLIKQSQQKPDKNAQELLLLLFPNAEEKLVQKQKTILNQLPGILSELTEETKKTALEKLEHINLILDKQTTDDTFKRGAAISGLRKMHDQENNQKNRRLLAISLDLLGSLPSSLDDSNAFIVKYSRRSPREIGERLIEPLSPSAEHIKAEILGGESMPHNYLLAHIYCNKEKGHQKFPAFIRKNPQVIPHIENQIKVVCQKIQQYNIRGLADYPQQVTETLKIQSKGLINIPVDDFILPEEPLKIFVKSKNYIKKLGETAVPKPPRKQSATPKLPSPPKPQSKKEKSLSETLRIISAYKKLAREKAALELENGQAKSYSSESTSKTVKIKKPKNGNKNEALTAELISMFESQPLNILRSKIQAEIIARESIENKNILRIDNNLLQEKIKEEERISNWAKEIHSAIQKEKRAQNEIKKQEIVNLFILSPIENMKDKIRAEIIARESAKVKTILKISLDLPNERMRIEKRIANWTKEINSSIQKEQKIKTSPQNQINPIEQNPLEDVSINKDSQNTEMNIKLLKKELVSLFINAPVENRELAIRAEIISRESKETKQVLEMDPKLLNERVKIEKRISALTDELYNSVLLKRKTLLTPSNFIAEKNEATTFNKTVFKDDKVKRELFELFVSSSAKNLEGKIKEKIIAKETDRVKAILSLDLELFKKKASLQRRISDLTQKIYEEVEKKQKENPQFKAQMQQDSPPKTKIIPVKPKNNVPTTITVEQLKEKLKAQGQGSIRQLKKAIKRRPAQKEVAPTTKGEVTTKPSAANKNSRRNRLAQKRAEQNTNAKR